MTGLYTTALEAQQLCESQGWSFCIIGGVAVQRWGEPRQTRDVDLTLLSGFGGEEKIIEVWLRNHRFRPPGSMGMALTSRVLLLVDRRGTPVDVALGGIDFERRSIQRSSLWKIPDGALRTCSAEDLLVHKVFAGREQDWVDVRGILARQKGKLDLALVRCELKPLLELQEQPDKLARLEQKIRENDRPFTTIPPSPLKP
ncbi:MAG: hypothetical protein KGR98_02495 [Verrucomicrobia bacterium]|nr:hypothetical protein [Verrucomicrobiota bacterium]MDE3098743.1 hypothetical protein [Verrucomicrobiota bacterium]